MFFSADVVNKKIRTILVCISIVFCIIIMRLIYLQMYHVDYFILQSRKNFTRHETIDCLRGNIFDCTGKLLATNRPVTVLYWHGTGNSTFSTEQTELLHHLETITGILLTQGDMFYNILHAEKRHQKVVLACDIPFSSLSKISELYPHHNNIHIDTHFKRFYPFKTYASHIVGYLGNVRVLPNGKLGLEKICNDDLSGKQGSKRNIVNSIGKRIVEEEIEKASMGNDIHTTINSNLQEICERVFPEHYAGTFIVMNPFDGAIVSLVSRPNFDPNIFLDPIPSDIWKSLQEKNPFLNRAFDACYPSGSVFKLVTISAALEHNIIACDALWTCKGYTLFGKRKYRCACRYGHGKLTIAQAVAESCNTLFYEIGKQIDIDILAHYAHKFGLGEKTNIIFSEKTGLIPDRAWKYGTKGEQWWPGETLSVAIGQSFLLVTPIQIARMIASIFTGYLVSPRLLKDEPVHREPLDIKPETIAFLKKSMKRVVRQGTGRRVSKIKGIEMYAKTSTAQTSALEKRMLDPHYLEHGWFVGNFKYQEHQPLTIVILVEQVGTAQVAATVARDFLVEYKKYMDKA